MPAGLLVLVLKTRGMFFFDVNRVHAHIRKDGDLEGERGKERKVR